MSFIVLRISYNFLLTQLGQIAFTRLVFRLFVPHFDVGSTRHHAVTPAAVKDYISQATPLTDDVPSKFPALRVPRIASRNCRTGLRSI